MLKRDEVPVGEPLAWPIVDENGTLLVASGTTLPSEACRDFLFAHFDPCRDTAEGTDKSSRPDIARGVVRTVTLEDLQLAIGARFGVRSQHGMGHEMRSSRLIGISPNRALFITPPLGRGDSVSLTIGENVEIVAIGGEAIFWFVCTVVAVCKHPFDFVVLSDPGGIRRLRERKGVRMRTKLAVRYGTDVVGDTVEGLGVGCDLSAHGMSLAVSAPVGQVGDRLRVSFPIKMPELEMEFQAVAIIRNIQPDRQRGDLATHGLEFEGLGAEQQIVLKALVGNQPGTPSRVGTAA